MFIALLVLALAAAAVAALYNGIIRRRNLMREAWGGIEAQLKRRHDLIPQFVEAVKGSMTFEKTLLERITALRTESIAVRSIREKGEIENNLSSGLHSLFALAENYPELKSVRSVTELQNALIDTEDQLQYARRYYNGTVRDYADRLQTFPGNIVARIFEFAPGEYFALEKDSEREVPSTLIGASEKK